MTDRRLAVAALIALSSRAPNALGAQQGPDTAYHATVARPAYRATGPIVRLDEAHHNFHTVAGRYAPFVALLRHDGYRVEPGRARFTDASLRGATVLVIANASGSDGPATPAFTAAEVAAG
ncbi:hypothetical protein J421_6290 (plasmid) [Gemmatirosa kalamazoonensis]|uniref:Uncharacterized protein n=1 Tax=Gemmatirosa kalamazoonensis TaxID=861299 RepID=W0RU37_9BACT|nr:hypothetical protein [Gemmatirosa kalamazoonensis]AHG93825.1 hypothetical protein J421_6290 [Gemmatirosa kalamazoonensis]